MDRDHAAAASARAPLCQWFHQPVVSASISSGSLTRIHIKAGGKRACARHLAQLSAVAEPVSASALTIRQECNHRQVSQRTNKPANHFQGEENDHTTRNLYGSVCIGNFSERPRLMVPPIKNGAVYCVLLTSNAIARPFGHVSSLFALTMPLLVETISGRCGLLAIGMFCSKYVGRA